MAEITPVSIDKIDFNDKTYTFRHTFNVTDLENSIRYEGLLYPPIVIKKGDRFTIVSGYRRLLACKNLEMTTVSCIVHEKETLDTEEFLKISIAENTKRKNLKPIEIADALARIKEELNIDNSELAEQFGETFEIGNKVGTIEKYLKLTALDSETKDFLTEKTSGNIEFELTDLSKKSDRDAVMDLIKENEMIKKGQLHKIIESAKSIEENSDGNTKFKEVLKKDSVQDLLHDQDLKGSKKINAIVSELEKRADPDKASKQQHYETLLDTLEDKIFAKNPGWLKKIAIKKKKFGEPETKLTLDFSTEKEFLDLLKFIYEQRKEIISPILKL